MSSLLEVSDLSVRFRTEKGEMAAVEQLSLTVARGEFLGIVGESGSGKSTVARMMCGLEQPSIGSLVIDGVDVTDGSKASQAHQQIGRAHV